MSGGAGELADALEVIGQGRVRWPIVGVARQSTTKPGQALLCAAQAQKIHTHLVLQRRVPGRCLGLQEQLFQTKILGVDSFLLLSAFLGFSHFSLFDENEVKKAMRCALERRRQCYRPAEPFLGLGCLVSLEGKSAALDERTPVIGISGEQRLEVAVGFVQLIQVAATACQSRRTVGATGWLC